MSDAPELEATLWAEAVRVGVGVRPIVLPTPWRIGPVTAYLIPSDPVTLVDAGYDMPEGRRILESALVAAGLEGVADVDQIIVTHGHSDHFGCARWIQERSGCRVLMHPLDIEGLRTHTEARETYVRELFGPLGLTAEMLDRYVAERGEPDWQVPEHVDPLQDGDRFDVDGAVLEVMHRPGHSPGHVWVRETGTGIVFCGDFLLAASPTNAGLEPDPTHPTGRRPMLELYNAGLRELAGMDAPVVFPAHGPPITDHTELIERRLAKSDRRTDHVLDRLAEVGEANPLELASGMFGERLVRNPYPYLSDVTGRLDLLVADGRVEARIGDDGVWYYRVDREAHRDR